MILDNFIKSANAVLPIFILVVLGYVFNKIGFLSKAFYEDAEKFVFKVALPCQIFLSIIADTERVDATKTIVFCTLAITAAFLLAIATVPLIIKDNGVRGAVIQNCYRSNLAVLGLPLITSVAGAEGRYMISMLMPFAVTLFNVYTVIELNIFAPKDTKKTPKQIFVSILKSIVTNPLIIASVLGVIFLGARIKIPAELGFITDSLDALSVCTEALVLIALGASFSFASLKGKIKFSLPTAVYKTLLLPLAAVFVAHYGFGFANTSLAVIFITFGAPSAVSSYIMAKSMKSDAEVAGQVLLLSTVISTFTIFLGLFLMKNLGWIV